MNGSPVLHNSMQNKPFRRISNLRSCDKLCHDLPISGKYEQINANKMHNPCNAYIQNIS